MPTSTAAQAALGSSLSGAARFSAVPLSSLAGNLARSLLSVAAAGSSLLSGGAFECSSAVSALIAVAAGTDASNENQRAGRRKTSTTSRAIAAATGASSASSTLRRVKPPGRTALKSPMHTSCVDLCCCRDRCSNENRAGRGDPRQHSEHQLLQQKQAQPAARVMMRVKSPLADCPEVAHAYFTARLVAAGTAAPARIVELGEEVLHTSRATAAATGASSASSTRDQACETSRADYIEVATACFMRRPRQYLEHQLLQQKQAQPAARVTRW